MGCDASVLPERKINEEIEFELENVEEEEIDVV